MSSRENLRWNVSTIRIAASHHRVIAFYQYVLSQGYSIMEIVGLQIVVSRDHKIADRIIALLQDRNSLQFVKQLCVVFLQCCDMQCRIWAVGNFLKFSFMSVS